MAKLYFNYSTMNAGKSTILLQASYNYNEGGMETYLLTPSSMTAPVLAKLPAGSGLTPRRITFHPKVTCSK